MTIKDKITAEPGFAYIIDAMELMSSVGRSHMMRQPFCTDPDMLREEYRRIETIVATLNDTSLARPVATIRHQLMQLHDLQGTIANLLHGNTLEEIELFELKKLAFLCMETMRAASAASIDDVLAIPDLQAIFDLLDPDQTHIATFYIYDSYHPELPELRRQLKATQSQLDNLGLCASGHADPHADKRVELQKIYSELFEQQNIIQQQVITTLSEKLQAYTALLTQALAQMAYTDFLFAKSTLANEWGLTQPTIADAADKHSEVSHYRALFNPRLLRRNHELHRRYQRVDISLSTGATLITGANMAGKTVLLKTVGIAQLMAQFGFFVPAEAATIGLVDDVLFCIGDEQNEMNGLSSFASEIIKISDTISRSQQQHLLILIDEPARTTNPIEGKALVQSLASILNQRNSLTLITTHYSQLGLACRRLRVRGFTETMSDQPLSPDNINDFMDYSLLADNSDDVPQEALRIAAILHCDDQLLAQAQLFLNNQDTEKHKI